MTTQATVAPIEKTVNVDCSVEHAFEVFTERIGQWWPLHMFSITVDEEGGNPPETVIMEMTSGGRLYERTASGEELDWGKVLVWEPPKRLVLEWRPSREPTIPTEIEIRFTADAQGTRVDLEHRGWERLGARAAEARAGYDSGWRTVIGLYAGATSA